MSLTPPEAVLAATEQLPGVGLEQVVAMADLQTRTDRKYLMTADVFARFSAIISDRFAVLEIQGRRLFKYESVYFDTEGLTAYRQHAHGRRRRFKVRTRAYLDVGECVLEVKTEGGRGETIKERLSYPWADRHELTDDARRFARDRIGDPEAAQDLAPVITSAYRRATLVDPSGSRLTCDVDIAFTRDAGTQDEDRCRREGPVNLVLVESKTVGVAATADHVLWALGQRPVPLSKYCVGMALTHPDLPANRWNRELRGHFDWTPQRRAVGDGTAPG
jgi:hypothetical protein